MWDLLNNKLRTFNRGLVCVYVCSIHRSRISNSSSSNTINSGNSSNKEIVQNICICIAHSGPVFSPRHSLWSLRPARSNS